MKSDCRLRRCLAGLTGNNHSCCIVLFLKYFLQQCSDPVAFLANARKLLDKHSRPL